MQAELFLKNQNKTTETGRPKRLQYLNWPRNCGMKAYSPHLWGPEWPRGTEQSALDPVKGRCSLQMGSLAVGMCQVRHKAQLMEAKFKIRAQT